MSDSVSERHDFAHDPLCDEAWDHEFTDDQPCGICAAIAKGREDMLERCEEAAFTDLLALEDDIREALGKGSDAERIVAGYRSAMPGFQKLKLEK